MLTTEKLMKMFESQLSRAMAFQESQIPTVSDLTAEQLEISKKVYGDDLSDETLRARYESWVGKKQLFFMAETFVDGLLKIQVLEVHDTDIPSMADKWVISPYANDDGMDKHAITLPRLRERV